MFPKLKIFLFLIALLGWTADGWGQGGTVVGWGDNRTGQASVPAGLNNIVAIASGEWHNLAQRADGTLVGWGYNAGIPHDLGKVVAFAAGGYHNLAVRPDGTVRAWGENASGQANVPAGLRDVVAVSGGWHHSLALKADGTVVGWGDNRTWQIDVPPGLSNVVAIAAAEYHNLALKSDGTVVGWGWNGDGQISIPASLGNNVAAIAAGGLHSLALKKDGTVVAWGWNRYGQTRVPPGLSNVVAIKAGAEHSLALKADGTVVGWGANDAWASNDPNCAVTWGPEQCPRVVTGQITPPEGLRNVIAIAAGNFHSIALVGANTQQPPAAPILSVGTVGHASVALSWNDVADETGYTLERKGGASDWAVIASPGAGVTSFTDNGVSASTSYQYRIRARNGAGNSAYSAELSVTTPVAPVLPPAAPALQATAASTTEVRLDWNDVANELNYQIERRLEGGGEWTAIKTLGSNATRFTDVSAAPGTSYVYRIRATNAGGGSAWAEASVRTPPEPGVVESSAVFVRVDSETSGLWPLEYGREGKWIASQEGALPEGISVTGVPGTALVWAANTTEERGLIGEGGSNRTAAGWSGAPLTLNLSIPRGTARRIGLYFLDWNRTGLAQQVTIRDAGTGTNLDTRSIEAFGNGKYLVYDIEGNVQVTLSSSGAGAVLSGIFVGGGWPAPISNNPLSFQMLGRETAGIRVRISGDSGQRFKVQKSSDLRTWTDVANSILVAPSTEMILTGEVPAGFFRTVNTP